MEILLKQTKSWFRQQFWRRATCLTRVSNVLSCVCTSGHVTSSCRPGQIHHIPPSENVTVFHSSQTHQIQHTKIWITFAMWSLHLLHTVKVMTQYSVREFICYVIDVRLGNCTHLDWEHLGRSWTGILCESCMQREARDNIWLQCAVPHSAYTHTRCATVVIWLIRSLGTKANSWGHITKQQQLIHSLSMPRLALNTQPIIQGSSSHCIYLNVGSYIT